MPTPKALPDEVLDAPFEDEGSAILSPEQRKDLLGKLANFELLVLALAPNQQSFVFAYLTNPANGAAAARRAGYNGNVTVRASKLLAMPKVAAAIAAGQLLREDRTFITSERTLNELSIIAFSNIRDFEVGPGGEVRTRDGVPEYAARAISSAKYKVRTVEEGDKIITTYETEIKLWSKPEALRMLAMYQKLLSGEGGVNLTVNNDNRGQSHTHNYLHNEWHWGDRKLKF